MHIAIFFLNINITSAIGLNNLRILIVEDEELAAQMLKQHLEQILGSDITTLKVVGSLTAAVCFIQEQSIDLLFLDLDLRGDDGFAILEEQVAQGFQTIIVSGNVDQAIKAFEYSVLDFISKPYSLKRLKKAIKMYMDRSNWKFCFEAIPVMVGNSVHLLPCHDIFYISRSVKKTTIHLAEKSIQSKRSLQDLEGRLPDFFIRIHRSYIINIKLLNQIHASSGGVYTASLGNGINLPVSRSSYSILKDLLHTA